jgi:histone H3/H4
MNQFKSDNISSKEVDDAIKSITEKEVEEMANNEYNEFKNVNDFSKKFSADIMKFFRQNMTELFDKIIEKANKIKETKSK